MGVIKVNKGEWRKTGSRRLIEVSSVRVWISDRYLSKKDEKIFR